MLFVRILAFLRGYITVKIRGQYPERLINICAARGIFLWDISRNEDGSVTAQMSINGFKRMPAIAKKSACRVHLVSRQGLPFILHRHRKRYVFATGVLLFILTCYILSLFVWKIEITGDESIDRTALMESLSRHGLHVGAFAGSVDNYKIKRGVMTDMAEVSWVGIVVNGSGAEVEVRRRVPKPEITDENRVCNLVASQNGVITALNISNGVKYVDIGNVVYKGQLLVSGVIETNASGIMTVPASGVVTATTWHEKTGVIPDKKEVRSRTGKEKSKHMLNVFGWKIPLFFSDKVEFENFDRESRVNKIWENDKFPLPFSFHYDKFYDVDISYEKLSRKEGIAALKEQLQKEVEKDLDPSAVVKEITWSEGTNSAGKPTLTVSYECSENIAMEKEALYEPLGEDNGSGEDGGDN